MLHQFKKEAWHSTTALGIRQMNWIHDFTTNYAACYSRLGDGKDMALQSPHTEKNPHRSPAEAVQMCPGLTHAIKMATQATHKEQKGSKTFDAASPELRDNCGLINTTDIGLCGDCVYTCLKHRQTKLVVLKNASSCQGSA